jgi:hypothetical protein
MSYNGNDWRLLTGREKYQAYLASREWGLLREAVKERSGGICERCHKNESTAVHHLTYARVCRERLEDLVDLCDDCHDFSHGRSDFDPAAPTPPPEERARRIREEAARIEAERVAISTPTPRGYVPIYYYNSTWRILRNDGAYLFSSLPYIDVVILNQSKILHSEDGGHVLWAIKLGDSKWMNNVDKPAILSIPWWNFKAVIEYGNYLRECKAPYSALVTRILCEEKDGQIFMKFAVRGLFPPKAGPFLRQQIDKTKWIKEIDESDREMTELREKIAMKQSRDAKMPADHAIEIEKVAEVDEELKLVIDALDDIDHEELKQTVDQLCDDDDDEELKQMVDRLYGVGADIRNEELKQMIDRL